MTSPVGKFNYLLLKMVLAAWEKFFRSCDLPSTIAKKYAQRFVKERMQPYMLKEITRDELKVLGIEALGDQVFIN